MRKQLISWVLVWGALSLVWCSLVVVGDMLLDIALAHSDKMGRELPVLAGLIRRMLDSRAATCIGGVAVISCSALLVRWGTREHVKGLKVLAAVGLVVLLCLTLGAIALLVLPFVHIP